MTTEVPSLRRPLGVPERARVYARSLAPRHAALGAILALSLVLDTYRLSHNGWANAYYSAAVKSMLGSLHNFLYVSFDPGGLVSVDKPPIALWVQTLSAKLFGLSSLSLLLPEAIAGVLSVGLLYRYVARRFGTIAGLAAALALAVFPSFVAVARDNNPDAILILLMVLACGAALSAIETGRLRTLVWSAVLVGLAFNTKMLAAYLVVPGIACAYLVCAPGSLRRRLAQLVVAGLVLAVVSVAWLSFVDLTPASQRPYVGSSQNNSEFGLALNYNGVGRVAGQTGGPPGAGGRRFPAGGAGALPHAGSAGAAPPLFGPAAGVPGGPSGGAPGGPSGGAPGGPSGGAPGGPSGGGAGPAGAPGGFSPPPGLGAPGSPPPAGGSGGPASAGGGPGGGSVFGGPTGPLRLFSPGLGDQGGWLIPLALAGACAVALTLRRRRDPRLAALLVLGGWFATEAVVLSASKGIVHPYYVSALAPGLAAMVGAGAVALGRLAGRGGWRLILPLAGVAGTIAAQLVLLHRQSFLGWWAPVLIGCAVAGVSLMVIRRRWARPAVAALVGVLLVAPAAYATTVWDSPVNGTFPAAGRSDVGSGGAPALHAPGAGRSSAARGTAPGPFGGGPPGGGPGGGRTDTTALVRFLRSHASGTRFALLTQSAGDSESLILDGIKASSMGGFNGDDHAVTATELARFVARGEARYVELGGGYPGRGGNSATAAVERACRVVPARQWQGPAASSASGARGPGGRGLTLYDCSREAGKIAAAGR